VVRKTRLLYNSPIFCVPKKNGQGLRILQDFRGLNAKTKMDKYSMKEISECISDIGRAGIWYLESQEDQAHRYKQP
jgi:hypothetical protein